jgi:4a-hydroxytetrahydrobiopterin dehydratase
VLRGMGLSHLSKNEQAFKELKEKGMALGAEHPAGASREMYMTDTLAGKTCTPCKGGVPPLTSEEAERFHEQVPRRELRDVAKRIEQTFRFRNFGESLSFVQRVGELAEREGHHPDICFGWATRRFRCRRKRSKGYMRMISSWRPRWSSSLIERQHNLRNDSTGSSGVAARG